MVSDSSRQKRNINLYITSQTIDKSGREYRMMQKYNITNSDLRTMRDIQAILEIIVPSNITINKVKFNPSDNFRIRNFTDGRVIAVTELPSIEQSAKIVLDIDIVFHINRLKQPVNIETFLSIQVNSLVAVSYNSEIRLEDVSCMENDNPTVASFAGNTLTRNVGLL